jgi:predicted phage tail protein
VSVLAGTLTLSAHPGTNKVRFAGRISQTRKLKLGRFTLQIIAINAQGQRSAPQSLSFTIVK